MEFDDKRKVEKAGMMEKHNKLADLLEELKQALRESVSTASDQELLLMKSWNEVLEVEVEELMWAISDLKPGIL